MAHCSCEGSDNGGCALVILLVVLVFVFSGCGR
jgi:hypothetical protein